MSKKTIIFPPTCTWQLNEVVPLICDFKALNLFSPGQWDSIVTISVNAVYIFRGLGIDCGETQPVYPTLSLMKWRRRKCSSYSLGLHGLARALQNNVTISRILNFIGKIRYAKVCGNTTSWLSLNELGWFWKELLVSTRCFDQYALIVFWRKRYNTVQYNTT